MKQRVYTSNATSDTNIVEKNRQLHYHLKLDTTSTELLDVGLQRLIYYYYYDHHHHHLLRLTTSRTNILMFIE